MKSCRSLFIYCIITTIIVCLLLAFRADEKEYDQRLTIDIYGKSLKEITEIKSEFDNLAEKFGLTVNINSISKEEIEKRDKWQKLLKKEKD